MKERLPFTETHPHLKEFAAFLESLNNESHRGSVLVAATMIDDLLLRSIQAFIIDSPSAKKLTDGFNAPLGTFSARSEAAAALGILTTEEYHDIVLIRRIRNDFAHSVTIDFKDERIKGRCKKLLFSAKDYEGVTLDAKAQFTTAATAIILGLVNRPHYAAKRRLSLQQWPY